LIYKGLKDPLVDELCSMVVKQLRNTCLGSLQGTVTAEEEGTLVES
jgi:hypothetical protein